MDNLNFEKEEWRDIPEFNGLYDKMYGFKWRYK